MCLRVVSVGRDSRKLGSQTPGQFARPSKQIPVIAIISCRLRSFRSFFTAHRPLACGPLVSGLTVREPLLYYSNYSILYYIVEFVLWYMIGYIIV